MKKKPTLGRLPPSSLMSESQWSEWQWQWPGPWVPVVACQEPKWHSRGLTRRWLAASLCPFSLIARSDTVMKCHSAGCAAILPVAASCKSHMSRGTLSTKAHDPLIRRSSRAVSWSLHGTSDLASSVLAVHQVVRESPGVKQLISCMLHSVVCTEAPKYCTIQAREQPR